MKRAYTLKALVIALTLTLPLTASAIEGQVKRGDFDNQQADTLIGDFKHELSSILEIQLKSAQDNVVHKVITSPH